MNPKNPAVRLLEAWKALLRSSLSATPHRTYLQYVSW